MEEGGEELWAMRGATWCGALGGPERVFASADVISLSLSYTEKEKSEPCRPHRRASREKRNPRVAVEMVSPALRMDETSTGV